MHISVFCYVLIAMTMRLWFIMQSYFLYQLAGMKHSSYCTKGNRSIKRRRAADWGWVGVWSRDGVPSSLWEQPGWARQAWIHDAGSHLALDEAPEGETGWCQPSENTSSMFENENDMFIYTVALCEWGYCVPAELWRIQKYYMFYICLLSACWVLKDTVDSRNVDSSSRKWKSIGFPSRLSWI